MEGSDLEVIRPKKGYEKNAAAIIEKLEKGMKSCARLQTPEMTDTIEALRKLLEEHLENKEDFQAKFNLIKEQNLAFLMGLRSELSQVIQRLQRIKENR